MTISVANGGATPTGTVTLYDGAVAISSALTLSSGATTFAATFGLGPHSLTAIYSGDSNNLTSTSSATIFTVAVFSSNVSVTSSVTTISMNQPVTYTATIVGVGSGIVPTGTVTFNDGTANLGTATISGGVAVRTVPMINRGTRTITAVYNGDSNFSSSSGSMAETVVPPATTGACFAPL